MRTVLRNLKDAGINDDQILNLIIKCQNGRKMEAASDLIILLKRKDIITKLDAVRMLNNVEMEFKQL